VTRKHAEAVRTRAKVSRERRSPRISVVIPALNEAGSIAWVLENMPLDVDEIVLVDGRSTDRTVEVALAVRPDTVVVLDDARGKGCAIRKGIETATGDFVVMLDADGSMDPREITRFVQPLVEGHDLVRGSRFLPGGGTSDMSGLRNVGNRGLLLLTRILYGVKRSDLCYGYAAFRRSSILSLGLTATGFEIEAQLFLRAERARLSVAEVASFEALRRAGTSNLHAFRDGRRVLQTIISERLRSPEPTRKVVAIPVGAVAASSSGGSLRPRLALEVELERPTVWSRAFGLTGSRQPRHCPERAPDERAMAAALVWALAVKHGDARIRAIALADYRRARRQAATALAIPGSIRFPEIRQELATLRP
jgi:hypothetical protein